MVIGNQHKILLGLVLFLAALLMYRVINPYRQQTVPKLTYGRTTKISPDASKTAYRPDGPRPTKVMTTLFKDPPRVVFNTHRDPFRKALPPVPRQASQPSSTEPQPPPVRRSAIEQAKEQLGRFKVFGSFQQGNRVSLFLQRGKQVLVISAGERLDGKFKIESIDGYTAVVSASEIEAPFEFGFEEVAVSDNDFDIRPSPPPPRAAPRPRPVSEPFPASPDESTPTELSDSSSADSGETAPAPPPSLPAPPPTDSPAPPFTSKGSPSRSYLPGNKPPESD